MRCFLLSESVFDLSECHITAMVRTVHNIDEPFNGEVLSVRSGTVNIETFFTTIISSWNEQIHFHQVLSCAPKHLARIDAHALMLFVKYAFRFFKQSWEHLLAYSKFIVIEIKSHITFHDRATNNGNLHWKQLKAIKMVKFLVLCNNKCYLCFDLLQFSLWNLNAAFFFLRKHSFQKNTNMKKEFRANGLQLRLHEKCHRIIYLVVPSKKSFLIPKFFHFIFPWYPDMPISISLFPPHLLCEWEKTLVCKVFILLK